MTCILSIPAKVVLFLFIVAATTVCSFVLSPEPRCRPFEAASSGRFQQSRHQPLPVLSVYQATKRRSRLDFVRLAAESKDSGDSKTEAKEAPAASAPPKKNEEEGDKNLSFDDAALNLREEEEQARAERAGRTLTDEKKEQFAAKQSEYDSMRDRIRSRAKEMNIEKSVATQKAIEEATQRALNQEEAPSLDLTAFGDEDSELEDLTDEEREEVEKITKMSIPDQIKEEWANTKWPSFGQALRLTGVMAIIFVLTAAYILKVDDIVRNAYTNWGLIPSPDAVFDFSDLELPEGWNDNLDEATNTLTDAIDILKEQ